MNCKEVYERLIAKRKQYPLLKMGDGTIESHHIIPKSYGGTDDISNRINLTLREHFVAHLLLYHDARKSNDIVSAGKMACALYSFMNRRQHTFNSHVYESLRRGKAVGDESLRRGKAVGVFWKGRKHDKSSRQKIRNTMTPKNSTNKRVWVCKDGLVKYIRKDQLEEYLSIGFELGRQGYKPRKGKQGSKINVE